MPAAKDATASAPATPVQRSDPHPTWADAPAWAAVAPAACSFGPQLNIGDRVLVDPVAVSRTRSSDWPQPRTRTNSPTRRPLLRARVVSFGQMGDVGVVVDGDE